MATDARISVSLPTHPKTKKLIRKLGQSAGWNLVCLFLWAAANRPDGDLSGMSAEDIEIAADWSGDEGAFVSALVGVRFLDGKESAYELHDWAEHNPWAAGAEARSAKARWNAVRRHHGHAEADRQVPEYAAIRNPNDAASNASSNADSNTQHATSMHGPEHSNAPSPSPSPTPTYSVPKGTGAEAPSDQDPDPIFGDGLAYLVRCNVPEKGARSFLGKMRKELKDDLVAVELLVKAQQEEVSDPIPWLRAAAKRRIATGRTSTGVAL